jgi:hypothetical protein
MTQLDDSHLGSSHSSLIEVFPSTYQALCQPLLILDKAAYLFMQFVNIGRTMAINHTAVKAFLRCVVSSLFCLCVCAFIDGAS